MTSSVQTTPTVSVFVRGGLEQLAFDDLDRYDGIDSYAPRGFWLENVRDDSLDACRPGVY